MNENKCPACGASINLNVTECKYCGEVITVAQQPQYQAPNGGQVPPQYAQGQPYQGQPQQQYGQPYQGQPQYGQPPIQQIFVQQPAAPVKKKSKVAAGLLGIFLGGFGVHKFYLGKVGMGILYLLFCWTYIPGIVGFIEGIVYLASNEEKFNAKYSR